MYRALTVTSVLLAATAVAAVPAHASMTTTNLVLQDATGTALDRLHDRLVVGGSGAVRSGVLILNPDGSTVASLLQTTAVSSVAVALSGHTAWAASSDATALFAINLDDVSAPPRAFPLPTGDQPQSVAPVSERFVAYSGQTSVGVLDTRSGTTQHITAPLSRVHAMPYTTKVLEVASGGTQVTVLDVASGTPRQVGGSHTLAGCPGADTEAVSPDGRSLAVVCDTPTDAGPVSSLREYRLSDFALLSSYPLPRDPNYPGRPDAVAWSRDANYVAVGELTLYGNDVFLFHRTGTHFSGVYATDLGAGTGVSPGGLVFSPDGTRLQTVAEVTGATHGVDRLTFVSLPGAPSAIALPPAVVTVSGPASARVGDSVTLTGTVTYPDTSAYGASIPLTVTRTLAGHSVSVTINTDATGHFTFTNTPTEAGPATYTVVREADSLHDSGSASTTTVVSKRPTSLTLTATYQYGPPASYRYTVHLGTTFTNRVVSLTVNDSPVASGTVDASGNLVASWPDQCQDQPPGCAQLAEATFAGDARYAPAVADLDLTNYVG